MRQPMRLVLLSALLAVLSACGGQDSDPPDNQPPVADAGVDLTVNEGQTVQLDGSASRDPDGAIAAYAWEQTGGPAVSLSGADTVTASFTAPETQAPVILTFRLTVTDDASAVTIDEALITVNSVNQPPAAADDSAATAEDLPVVIDVLANDSDPDGAEDLDPATVSVSKVTNGATSVNPADGRVTFMPATDFFGNAGFTYTVSDLAGAVSAPANVTVSVSPVNDAPQAFDDGAATNEDTLVVVNVLANDVDVDSALDPASVAIRSESHGVATVNPETGAVGFLPDANYFGEAGFTYTVADVEGAVSNVATVAVLVNPVNDAPLANAASFTLDEDTPFSGTLTGSDVDNDPATLTFGAVMQPASGQLTLDTGGSFTYTPNLNFAGSDSFTFKVNDGAADSAAATVTLNVTDVAEAALSVDNVSVEENAAGAALVFTVRLSRVPDSAVTVTYTTQDGTAAAGADYTSTSGSLEFSTAGTLEQAVTVPVNDDAFDENDETVMLVLTVTGGASNVASSGATGLGTIVDNEDKQLLRAGAAKRSVTPEQKHIDGVVERRVLDPDPVEPSAPGPTRLQKFNLGGFGVDPFQNFPDPSSTITDQSPIRESPAQNRLFVGSQGEEHTWVRVLVVEDPKVDVDLDSLGIQPLRVAFVVVDAIGAGNIIQDGLKAAVVAATRTCGPDGDQACLTSENIMFGQTHSHAGADLQGLWGGVPQDWINSVLYAQAAAAVKEAITNLRPARLSLRQGLNFDFNNYRRAPLDPNADADGTLTLLHAVADEAALPIGSILQYNAHPTSIHDERTVHADFILGAMDWLEANQPGRPGGVALYYNGPIADASSSGRRSGCNYPGDENFGDQRCKGEGMADAALAFGETKLESTLEVRHQPVVLPITNPLFVAAGLLGSFNRYYDFLMLRADQIPVIGPLVAAQIVNLPQITPVAITNVSRVTIGGADNGLEVVTIPGEATNTFGQYIRGLASTNVMLLGLTENSFGYIVPEEEFSYVNESNPEGKYRAFTPFLNYEEFVSLGPLTAPLLRIEGYNRLFDVDLTAGDTRDLPPWLTACADPKSEACVLNYLGQRLDFFQRTYAAQCREQGRPEEFCSLLDPETPLADECRAQGFPEGLCSVFGQGSGGEPPPADENPDQALLIPAVEAFVKGCDILDPAHCLFPFPSDHFTVKAAAGSPQSKEKEGTGKRINFSPLAMPRNAAGKPIDPTEWNRNDGFSPGQMIVTYVPEIATVKDQGKPTGPIVGAPPITDVSQSLQPNASIFVMEADTLDKHLVWAEIDLNAGLLLPAAGVPSPRETRAAILIRPALNFKEDTRYIVVLRNLQRDDGSRITAGSAFRACLDPDFQSLLPPVAARCQHLRDNVFPQLQAAVVALDPESLYLAWDFTVASTENNVGRLRQMRQDAFLDYLGQKETEDGEITDLGNVPGFSITEIRENPNDNIARRVRGVFTVPSYVVPADPSPAERQAELQKVIRDLAPQIGPALDQANAVVPLIASASAPPNRLFYLPNEDSANACNYEYPDDAEAAARSACVEQARYGDGLPDRSGEMTTTFTCNIPRATLSGKKFASENPDEIATAADVIEARPSLYGHGLLGTAVGEVGAGNVRSMSNEHNVMFCAADWFGFATGDAPNVAATLVDMSSFPVIPDSSQQGMINQLFLARLLHHPQGFASDQAFQVQGQPVFDTREVFYDGNSQGGILGGVVVAMSKDITRGVLGVPGMNYSTLLRRSVDFDPTPESGDIPFATPLYLMYQDDLDRDVMLSLIQMLWDRSENNGYAHHITNNKALNGPDNQVLLHPAFADHQVTMWSAEVMARTIGARVDRTRVTPARHPDEVEYFGLETLDYNDPDHQHGSAIVIWDNNQQPPPPIGNVPPREGSDPHSFPRGQVVGRCQKSHFLQRSGALINVPARDSVAGGFICPPVINEGAPGGEEPPPPDSSPSLVLACLMGPEPQSCLLPALISDAGTVIETVAEEAREVVDSCKDLGACGVLTGSSPPAQDGPVGGFQNASCEAGTDLGGNRSYQVLLTGHDGETISFQVLEPTNFNCAQRASGAHPLILDGHGYGGGRRTSGLTGERNAGYTVISIDQRGFGQSSGSIRVMDPEFEGQYLNQILDWAEANLDYLAWRDESTGVFIARPGDANSVANGPNLVTGAIGGSYGGGYQLLLLMTDTKKRLDAIQPDITWHDLRYSLNPGDVIKAAWDLALSGAGEATGHASGGPPLNDGQDPFIKETLARGSATNEFTRAALDWFRYHSLSHWCTASDLPSMPYPAYGPDAIPMLDPLRGNNVPPRQPDGRPGFGSYLVRPDGALTHFQGLSVLITQSIVDTLFNFNEAWWNAECLRAAGADVSLYTHNVGHAQLRSVEAPDGLPIQSGSCPINRVNWFNSKLKPGAPDVQLDEVCLVLNGTDRVSLAAADVLAPQPSQGVGGGDMPGFTARAVAATQVPNGLFAATSAAGAVAITVPLGAAQAEGILAGIPFTDLTVSSLSGVNELAQDCGNPMLPTVRTGCDSITFVGLGLRTDPSGSFRLIDHQLTPLRGLGHHRVDLAGIAERLNPGDELALMLYGQHVQFVGSHSRDLSIPAVNVSGTVFLPVYGLNADGRPDASLAVGVFSQPGGTDPEPESTDSLVGCLLAQDPMTCMEAVARAQNELDVAGRLAAIAECFPDSPPSDFEEGEEQFNRFSECTEDERNRALRDGFNALYDFIGADIALGILDGIVAACSQGNAAAACEAVGNSGGTPDRLPLAAELVQRGTLVVTDANAVPPAARTVDGNPDDWMGQASRIGGTVNFEFGEHIYNDYVFDAYGADDGDDARRLAATLLLYELNTRTGRVDQLFQAAGDQFDAPRPAGAPDHYGDTADLEDGVDLSEVRWASDGSALFLLARVTRLIDPENLVILVLADTRDGASGMAGLNAGLTTSRFDRAAVLSRTDSRLIDLTSGASTPLGSGAVAVNASGYGNALEAALLLSLVAPDGKLRVAVMTARANADGSYTPVNVAYRFNEPVAGVYNDREQALVLYRGNVDGFVAEIALADLTGGRTQIARPGPGYHERQFLSGNNISLEDSREDGRLQHYGLFIPGSYPGLPGERHPLTVWLHYRGGKAHSGAAWTPRLIHQLGEEQGNIVVTPRGRGTSNWYMGRSHQDVWEVFADVAGTGISGNENLPGQPDITGLLNVDARRVYLSGYSMGGYGTYLFGLLYPDKFAAGYSTSGAPTQGAWTGFGPDESFCRSAGSSIPGVGTGNACFVETNDGNANAQLNWRLLENARHVPLVIHHGSNDELVPITGIQSFGERLLELGYRYDLTTFLGYEHFTQAIMDEWGDGAHYLKLFNSPENPRTVTYKVVPGMVTALNVVRNRTKDPNSTSFLPAMDFAVDFNPDGAYWVDGLAVRTGGCVRSDTNFSNCDPTAFGQIEATSEALPGDSVVAVPSSQTGYLPPYLSTPVFSPGNHSTPYVRHGQDWIATGALPKANRFSASLTNLSVATLDLPRMGLDFGGVIEGSVRSEDGNATLTLAGVGADMTLCVGGAAGVNIAAGTNAVAAIDTGETGIWLAPGHDRICADVRGFIAAAEDRPDYSDLCESYGISGSEPACDLLRTAETGLRTECEARGGSAEFCTLFGGNLHGLLEECYLRNQGEEQLPVCRTVDAFVLGAAAYCRQVSELSGGAQRPELCALMGGVLISEESLAAYEQSWTHHALWLQNKLGYDLPLVHTSIVATHNSYNVTDANTPPTLSGSDANHFYDFDEQLRMGVRAIELDVHWMPVRDGPADTQMREPMVCHGDRAHAGCTYERPLREVLEKLRLWLNANRGEVIVLYVEDHLNDSDARDDITVSYDTAGRLFRDVLGANAGRDLIFRPDEHDATCADAETAGTPAPDPESWLSVSRRQIAAKGKQVLMYSEGCGQGAWTPLFHKMIDSGTNANIRQGQQADYTGRTYSVGNDNCVFKEERGKKWTRVWEDVTWFSQAAAAAGVSDEPGARITPAVARELMRCGMNMPSLDWLYPADGRLEAMVWSWATGQPDDDPPHRCAFQNADGRFEAGDCAVPRPYACVKGFEDPETGEDVVTNPVDWIVTGTGPAANATCPAGYLYGVPGNGYFNEKLKEAKAAAGATEVWLAYAKGADDVWGGLGVGAPPTHAAAAFRTEVGLKQAIAGFLSDVVGAVANFFGSGIEAFATAVADALQGLVTNLYAVIVGNENASLFSAAERFLANIRQQDADLIADLVRDIGAVLSGHTHTIYPTGTVWVGVGVVDMTPDVGYGAGQYADHFYDDPENFFGAEDTDPYATHKTQFKSYGVQSRLTARTLVVEGSNGKRIVLVKTDNYLAQDLLMRRVGQILEENGSTIRYPQILHHVTHNHSSSYLSTPSWGVWLFQDTYEARFFENQARKIAEAILIAETDLRPARMGATTVRHTIFKGNIADDGPADDGTPAGYPAEYGDHGLVVMRFDDVTDPQNPQPLAVWVNWGEHPEGNDGFDLHSADFLGPLERFVERDLGAPLVFSQGDVGSAEKSGNENQHLRDDGSVCNDEPDENCPFGEGVKRDWNHKEYAANERNVRYLADAIVKGWKVIGGDLPPDTPATNPYRINYVASVQVPFASDFVVDYRNAWVPGPVSHPYPSVSNCRSESTVEGNPGSPIIGLPNCRRGFASDSRTLLIWETLKEHGLPLPEHYDAPSFTGVEENLRLYLQTFRLGEVLLASCACEAQADLILNLESRADAAENNIYDGFDWACLIPEMRVGEPIEYTQACERQAQIYNPADFPYDLVPRGGFSNSDPATVARMRSQVHNDARGWDLPENAVAANSEPSDVTQIWGNFTKEEIQGLGVEGYVLPVGIGHAGDYNGYTVSYREYMGYDHYRKALTAYGPHTADYMVTRLVRMAAAMKGGAELAPEPHDTSAQADEVRQASQALLVGQATAAGFDAYFGSLADDLGPVEITGEPDEITRFQAAIVEWQGGSTAVDNPVVRVQRQLELGVWLDAYDMSGEVQTRVHWPAGLPEAGLALAGQFEWRWTAHFEAYSVFPAHLGSTPIGTYRFVVDGRSRQNGGLQSYHLESQPFTVSAWDGVPIQNVTRDVTGTSVSFTVADIKYPKTFADSAALFPYISASSCNVVTGERCSFRPWAQAGQFERAEVVVRRMAGGTETTETFEASCSSSGAAASCTADILLPLLLDDAATVWAFDHDGNFGTATVP